MAKGDKTAALLKVIRGPQPEAPGLKIVKVMTTEPNPITFVFEGTEHALDLELFEVPVDFYPLRLGDRLLVFPLVGGANGQRYGAVGKLQSGLVMGSTPDGGSTFIIPGLPKVLTAADVKIDANLNLMPGSSVAIIPTLEGTKIKYAIIAKM